MENISLTTKQLLERWKFLIEHKDDGNLNVHHIKPVSEGGDDKPENLITLCKECHKEIHRELNLKKENSYDKNT